MRQKLYKYTTVRAVSGCFMADDSDVLIDFGKWFKKSKDSAPSHSVHHTPSSHSSEDIDVDKIKDFFKGDFKNHLRWIVPAVVLIGVFIFAFQIRAQVADLPATEFWATDSVHRFYRNQIENQINQQFPNLPPENKNALIDKDFAQVLEENNDAIQQQIQATSQQFKQQFQDPTGQTYLLGIDPYYYFRQSRNLLEYGSVGTELRDGMHFDSYKPAPEGSFVENNLHPYIGVVVYKVMSIFSDISLMGAFLYVGALISALCVIPAFFIVRRAAGNVGGFFGAMFTAVNLFFVSRTAGESSDTDAYNVFFPLLISWTFLEALYHKNRIWRIALMSITGFFIAVYAFTWTGWWFIWYFLIAVLFVRVIYDAIRQSVGASQLVLWSDSIKQNIEHLVVLIVSTSVFASFTVGFSQILKLVARPGQFVALKEISSRIWPNVLTTVAELNPASQDGVIAQIGGYFLVTMAIIGILLAMHKHLKWQHLLSHVVLGGGIGLSLMAFNQEKTALLVFGIFLVLLGVAAIIYFFTRDDYLHLDITYLVLFGMWLAVTIWSTTRGVRFTLLIVPAVVIGVGLFCGFLYTVITTFITEGLHVPRKITAIVIFLLLLLVLVYPANHLKDSYEIGRRSVPSMNDGWYNALTAIKDNSSSDAIITSWWDFGHWFKAIADRPVTFDGGSQNRPQAHWVGKLLLTSDEKTSFGLLRMLDCGGNQAFDALDAEVNDVRASVDLLNLLIVTDRANAEEILAARGVSQPTIEKTIGFTHCTPPEGYVIASDDMIGKSGVWGHFGAWDFRRAEMVFKTRDASHDEAVAVLASDFNLSAADAELIYAEIITQDTNRWIAPWPGYVSNLQGCDMDNETIRCSLNVPGGQVLLNVDIATMNATLPTSSGVRYPNSIVFVEGNQIKEKTFPSDTIGLSVALVPNGNGVAALVADPMQARSMFTQMFFYEGFGLKCFQLLTKERQVTGGLVYVYKVNWDCVL